MTVSAAGLALMVFTLQRDLIFALVASLFVGLSMIAFSGLTNTVLQTTAPDRMLGRVMSVFAMILMGIMPLGQLALGALGSVFGIDVVLFAGGAATLAAGIYGFVRLPALRDLTTRARVVAHPAARTGTAAE